MYLEKIKQTISELNSKISTKVQSISDVKYFECGYKDGYSVPKGEYLDFNVGDRIFGRDKHYVLSFKVKTPKCPKRDSELLLHFGLSHTTYRIDGSNPQGLVYLNGKMTQGIDCNHQFVELQFDKEYNVDFYLYVGVNDEFTDFAPTLFCNDLKVKELYYDLFVPLEALICYEDETDIKTETIKALNIACNIIDWRNDDAFYNSIDEAKKVFDKIYYKDMCGGNSPIVHCIGHTHIDVAWLWTLAQTKEKAQRTFSTMLRLMEKYPEFRFMSSQPQLYEYVKNEAPEVYEQIKERVKEGRWEVEGAMWLEADCNLVSGESFIRQIMHGKNFMKNEFNVDSHILWLPDVFGYSAALPQVLKKCGVDNFVTSKISWNDTNRMPYDTFYWEGIDGTEIFSNFITAQGLSSDRKSSRYTTYNGTIAPDMALGTYKRYSQKEYNSDVFIPYGRGDGGGGPTVEMIETQRRLNKALPQIPKTIPANASEYLSKVKENFDKNVEILKSRPKWVGELYLEFHRGTYTSMAKNKKYNRLCEFSLNSCESISAFNSYLLGVTYPKDIIYSLWKTVLLNQFHDIIPGSSILEVYEESEKQYKSVLNNCNEIIDNQIEKLSNNINTDGGIFVYNPLGFDAVSTITHNGTTYETPQIPAFGWSVFNIENKQNNIIATKNSLENDYYKIIFDDKGNIISLFDKDYSREIIKENEKANEFQIFEDRPHQFDNWELQPYYKEKKYSIEKKAQTEIVVDGDRTGIKFINTYENSTITQTVFLYNTLERIDFVTDIDWQESHQVLKAVFPLDIHSNTATYDIQFGNLERPTYKNTSWDCAKFEVCAHKWMDISEDGYGVSLINDCKYGHSADGSTISLTLLKSGTYPNKTADKGEHHFTYSLLPHGGDFREGDTVKQAYILNHQMIAKNVDKTNGKLPETHSMIHCNNENIIIETVKQAENSDDIIIRLFDCYNRKDIAKIDFGFNVSKVYLCDMLENEIEEIEVTDNSIEIPVKNYEIITLKLKK